MSNPLFERTVTALLQERVICEVSDDELYNYLLMPGNQDAVNRFLGQINRTLRQTSAHDAFVCAYLDISGADTKDAIRHQFRDVANNLEAFVQFLRLVMMLEANDRPVLPGDKLSEGAILDRIAAAPALESKLRSLAEKGVSHQASRFSRPDSRGSLQFGENGLPETHWHQWQSFPRDRPMELAVRCHDVYSDPRRHSGL